MGWWVQDGLQELGRCPCASSPSWLTYLGAPKYPHLPWPLPSPLRCAEGHLRKVSQGQAPAAGNGEVTPRSTTGLQC